MISSTFAYALISGILPALLWLWFWLKEDNLHPEPRFVILLTFLAGMFVVPLVIPFQQIIASNFSDQTTSYLLWASTEEIAKFLAAYAVALHTKFLDEPIDAVIYMITVALGFAALENTFFILKPLVSGDTVQSIITGNLRFVGATLLHVVSSAIIGLFIALPLYKRWLQKVLYLSFGILLSIALHTAFNLFIINSEGGNTFIIFACVWASVVFIILMFEKIKNIIPPYTTPTFSN